MKYCSHCGNKLSVIEPNVHWECLSCAKHHYANPIPTVDVAFFDEAGKVLLGVRKNAPCKGKLNLPGGFVDLMETLEDAAEREIHEELGLGKTAYSELVYVGSRSDNHAEEGDPRQRLGFLFYCDIQHRDFSPSDEVSEYIWKLPAAINTVDMTSEYEYKILILAAKMWSKAR